MRIEAPDPRDDVLCPVLLALQHDAYRIEAELIGDDRIPPLHESLDDLRAARLSWLGALDRDRLAGAVAWSRPDGRTDLDRLVVGPGWQRRGIGRALVQEVLDRSDRTPVTVSTGRDNLPARTLYERLGFTFLDDVEVIPQLWISRYELRR